MDKGKYKFDSLNKKYDGFRGAAFSVKIDGKEYKSTELPLDELEVDICGDGSAGGCRFTSASLRMGRSSSSTSCFWSKRI